MEIYILRHGIAEEAHGGMRDADRALTPEGAKKLQHVLRRARAIDVQPPVILTSPYRRARETAQVAAEALRNGSSLLETPRSRRNRPRKLSGMRFAFIKARLR